MHHSIGEAGLGDALKASPALLEGRNGLVCCLSSVGWDLGLVTNWCGLGVAVGAGLTSSKALATAWFLLSSVGQDFAPCSRARNLLC